MRNSFVVILLVIVALGLSTPTMQSQSDCQPSISGPSISPSQFQGGVAPFTPIGGGEFQATTITITTTLSYNNPCDAQAAVILSLPSLSAPNNSTWISWQPFRDGAGNPMFPNPAAGVVPGHSGGTFTSTAVVESTTLTVANTLTVPSRAQIVATGDNVPPPQDPVDGTSITVSPFIPAVTISIVGSNTITQGQNETVRWDWPLDTQYAYSGGYRLVFDPPGYLKEISFGNIGLDPNVPAIQAPVQVTATLIPIIWAADLGHFVDEAPSNTLTITLLPPVNNKAADLGPCTDCEGAAGEPINLMTGNVWIQHRDYSLPGLGGGLGLVRTWNAQLQDAGFPNTTGIFGHSWRSTYEEQMSFPDSSTARYWRADGSGWIFTLGSDGQTYSVSSPLSEHASLRTDAGSGQSTISFPDGRKKIFNHAGYLIALIDRNGNQTLMTYGNPGQLLQITDPAGRLLNFSYGDSANPGQATSIQDAVGTIATYAYDANGHLAQVIYADGSALNFAYDSASLITSVIDSQGKVLEAHTYDDLTHRALTSSRANGVNSVSVDYGSSTITDSLGNSSQFASAVIGDRHFLNNFQGGGCSSCGSRTIQFFTHDAPGNRTSSTDSLGRTTNYTYDSLGNVLTKSEQLDSNAALTWSYTYNQFSQVLTVTDPAGNVTTNTYDVNGNLLSAITPAPDSQHPAGTTSFTYDTKGELTSLIDPLGHVTTMTYAPAGFMASVKDTQNNLTQFEYDGRGNRTAAIDALGNRTAFVYDVMNRLTQTVQPGNVISSSAYDYRGRKISNTDANGQITHFAFDDADRMISTTDAAGHTTTYGYDTESNLRSVVDATGHSARYVFDTQGRVTSVTFVGGGEVYASETYNYDEPGRLTSKRDRNGNTIQYSYDNLDRLTTKHYPDSTTVSYTYDILSRLTQVIDPSGTYSFAYDNMYRRIQASTQYSFLAGHTLVNGYVYDANSNLVSFTNPQGGVTAYAHDSLDRLTGITDFGGRTFGFGYDAIGRRTNLSRPNGVNTSYSYDALSRLLSLSHQVGPLTLDGAAYAYDAAGNRTSTTALPSNLSYAFQYDPIYQLTQVMRQLDQKATEKYTYDAVGDRLSSPGVPYTYDDQHRMLTREGTSYTYDQNGNTLSKHNNSGTTQYTWDFENRLTSVTKPDGSVVSFSYDPFGRRVRKISPSGTTIYVYDGNNIEEELTASGGVGERYTYGPGIDQPLVGQRQPQVFYYEADGLGSITSLTTTGGALAATYTYDSFGFLTNTTGSATNWFRYTGRQFDSDTGLYFYRARYYDSTTGRFLSEDPLRFRAGVNFYAYVRNSPLNSVDPSGLQDSPVNMPPMSDGIIQKKVGLNMDQICGPQVGGACTVLAAAILNCTCNCEAGNWKASPELRLYGSLYYYTGKFPYKGRKPKDPTVVDAGTAIAHEYNAHINPAIRAVTPLIQGLQGMSFKSEKECQDQCNTTSSAVDKLFRATLSATQKSEDNQ